MLAIDEGKIDELYQQVLQIEMDMLLASIGQFGTERPYLNRPDG
jgi:hypothetical protein